MKKKTREELIKEVYEMYGNEITILSDKYVNNFTKIEVQHNNIKCECYKWEITPGNLLNKRGCPACAGKIINGIEGIKRRIERDTGGSYEVLSNEYIVGKKITVKHKACGKVYDVTINNFFEGKRCKDCKSKENGMKKRKSDTEFRNEFNKLHQNSLELLTEYNTYTTGVEVHCLLCGAIWETTPASLLQGCGCEACGIKRRTEKLAFSQDKFEKLFYEKEENKEFSVGKYKNMNTEITLTHNSLVCGMKEFTALPNNLIYNESVAKCPRCSGRFEDISDVKWAISLAVGNEYNVLSVDYRNKSEKLWMQHISPRCNNNIFEMSPANFLISGHRCQVCSRMIAADKLRSDINTVRKKMYDLVGNEYTLISDIYINSDTKVKVRHNNKSCDNFEYEVTPGKFFNGRRCPSCYGNIKYTYEEVKSFFESDGEYELLSETYNDNKEDLLVKHINCNCEDEKIFKISLAKFLYGGSGCPCLSRKSKGERKIEKLLQEKNVVFLSQVRFEMCKNVNELPFDFIIKDFYNNEILIEYDGEHHFYPIIYGEHTEKNIAKARENYKKRIENDKIKTTYCKNMGLKLIRIPYTEFKNLEYIISRIVENDDIDSLEKELEVSYNSVKVPARFEKYLLNL